MAMPKKKARAIDVDERRYLWCANLQGAVRDLTVTCQHETGEGALLLVKAQHTDHWYRISVETGSLGKSVVLSPNEIDIATPSFVKSAIRFGLTAGWNPLSSGKPVVLRYQDGLFQLMKSSLNIEQMRELDDHIIAGNRLLAIVSIRKYKDASLQEAIDILHERYRHLRTTRSTDFSCTDEEYWNNFETGDGLDKDL